MGTRILTVEDDERIRTAVKLALEDEGWTVDEAASGEEAVEMFNRALPDVVLIDIMLPGMDGFELCRHLRRTSDLPIVMVTARADTHDIVAGLEAGADDYLTKPFNPEELVLRAKAILRRGRVHHTPEQMSVVGDVAIDRQAHRVRVAGQEVVLTPTEYRLLLLMVDHAGQVQQRQHLLQAIWGAEPDMQTRTVDVHVQRLRSKLGTAGDMIETVRGFGYRFSDASAKA